MAVGVAGLTVLASLYSNAVTVVVRWGTRAVILNFSGHLDINTASMESLVKYMIEKLLKSLLIAAVNIFY